LAVVVLNFAGCTNPAAGIQVPNITPVQTPINEVLGTLFGSGATVTDNEDSSFAVIPGDAFDGKILIPDGITADSQYIIKGDDGNYLDLSSLNKGDEISITFPGDRTYVITGNEDGSYTFSPREAEPPKETDRQILDDYIALLKANLADFVPGEDGSYSLAVPYASEKYSLALPAFPEGLSAEIIQDGHTVEILDNSVTFLLAPDATSEITIALVLNAGNDNITLRVTREPSTLVPVSNITLSPVQTTVTGKAPFDPVTVNATIEPNNATIQALEWESSDDSVVKVSDGVLTPQKSSSGKSVTVTAKATDGSGVEASMEITVVSNDNSLTGLKVGGTNALVSFAGFNVSVANSITLANITFTMEENANAEYKMSSDTVYTPISGASFTVDDLQEGDNVIDIVITAESGDSQHYLLTIARESSDHTVVDSITLTPSALTLTAGGNSGTVTADILPVNATNQTISWISSNPAVAKVDASGTTVSIIPVSRGNAAITAQATDSGGVSSNAVTVVVQSDDSSLSDLKVDNAAVSESPSGFSAGAGTNASVGVSFTKPMGAAAKYQIGSSAPVAFTNTSEEPDCSFTVNNLIVGENTISITITSETGSPVLYSLTITRDPTKVESIVLSPNPLVLTSAGATGSFTVSLTPSDPTDPAYTWSSSDASIATVNAGTGVVTAVAPGEAEITLQVEAGGAAVTQTAIVHVQSWYTGISGLEVNGKPVPGADPYSVTVENDVTTAGVSFTMPANANATFTAGGTTSPITSQPFSVPLTVGANEIRITVTAENGDSGSYTLTVTRQGSAQINFEWAKPGDIIAPIAGTVTLGGSVTISINPPDSGAYTYEWFVDGNPVTDSNTNTYTFSSNGNDLGKNYNIALEVYQNGNVINGDSITVTVTE